MQLSEEQFVQDVPYSMGSLRNHMVHLVDDDLSWFSLLEGKDRPQHMAPEYFATRAEVRHKYDSTEAHILDFVRNIDEAILRKEFAWHAPVASTPQRVMGWQVFLHVVNHGTDHRGQILRILHDFGAPSFDQDLMGYWVQTGKTVAQ